VEGEDQEPSSKPTWDFEERAVAASFNAPWEAELARARLEAEGVEAVLGDDNLIHMDWFVAQAVGGVKVLVRPEELARAAEILRADHSLPEVGLAEAEDSSDPPRCPRCNSTNLVFERWNRWAFIGSLLALGFPLPVRSHRYRCTQCRGVWRPEEVGSAVGPAPP
jgi:Putative prokaryotic signal transducing protein